jgi:hypothetical protein
VYEVFHIVETGVVLLFIVFSNCLSFMLSAKLYENIALRLLPTIWMFANPN